MKSNESTPSWVQPVDGVTCAALSRELWEMLRCAQVEMPVVDFAMYVAGATVAFQREYAAAVWGEHDYDWMECTERFLARYLREHPILDLANAWERNTLPLPDEDERDRARVGYDAEADEAISYAVRCDALAESGGREVTVALERADVPCINYGSGIVEVLWGVSSADLRVQVFGDGEAAFADVHIVRLMDDGHTDYYDEVAVGIPLGEVVEVVRGVLAKVHDE